MSNSYRDLLVWKKAIDLVQEIYRVSERFPKDELYGLTNQTRRSAVSIPSNIAEGQIRASSKDFQRFLRIALGALAELDTQLEIAKRLEYLIEDDLRIIENMIPEIRKMLFGLIKSLSQKAADN